MGTRPSSRVLIIVQNLPVPFDRRVWLECQTLVAAGSQVSVICPKGPGDPGYELIDGVHVYKYAPPKPHPGLLGYAWEFLYCWIRTALLSVRVLRRHGFDVIQACNPPDTYWALALPYKLLLRKRFVYDQHDLCPEVYESRFDGRSSALLGRLLLLLERATYLVADHVVSTNESYRQVAISRGGCDPKNVTVVRSGPDTDRMRPGAPVPVLRAGRENLVVYLGVMGPQDGVEHLLHAWSYIINGRGRRDCHLALLGFGDSYESLRALATDLQLDDFVTFTGRADSAVVASYLSTAVLGVCPDPLNPLNDVSTMNKTMEYMAFGLPVVSFDLTETRVSAGAAALYVEPNDEGAFAETICALLDDPPRRGQMSAHARRRAVESLDWRTQAADYLAVFDVVLDLPPQPLYVLPSPDRSVRGTSRFIALPELRVEDRRDVRSLIPAQRSPEVYTDRRRSDRRLQICLPLTDAPLPATAPQALSEA
jgi:glycosyltransferase involved in cell wall biosynthesis